MAAGSVKFPRRCAAFALGCWLPLACDPNVVIGAKWHPEGEAGSATTGAVAGSNANGGSGGSAASGGTVAEQGGADQAGAFTDGGQAGANDGVIFLADQENGSLSAWDVGPDEDSGGYYADGELPRYTTDHAHSGKASIEVNIDTSSGADQIARLYRRVENHEAYYAAWFYLNEDHTPGSWWSILLFRAVKDRSKSIDLWSVDLVRTADNKLSVALFDHASGKTIDAASPQPIVHIKQWFQLQAYLKQAEGEPSQLIVWFDGAEVLRLDSATPAPAGQPLYWVIGNGGSKMTPPYSTLYIDDAEISTSFVPL